MKRIIFSLFFLSTLLTAHAQTFTEPAKYNDYIVEQQNLIGQKIMAFTSNFEAENLTVADVMPILEELLGVAKNAVSAVKNLTPYEGDTQLKLSATELFQFYVQVIDRDYREMVNLFFGGALTEDSVSRLQEIVTKITADEAAFDANFQEAQQAFAKKYNFTLQANQLQEEIDKD